MRRFPATQGLSHASASVRAAACSIVVAMPAAAFHCLDKHMQQQLQASMLAVAGRDAAAAPRAAAVRAAALLTAFLGSGKQMPCAVPTCHAAREHPLLTVSCLRQHQQPKKGYSIWLLHGSAPAVI